jgi:glycosyltransferase involved in cell wall biosynthesis
MRLVDLAPYGVYPPLSGAHRLVHHLSLALGARHDVTVLAAGLRRLDGVRWRSFVQRPGGRYTEYRHVTPLTYLSYARRRRSGLPPLRASADLRLTAPPRLRQAVATADLVQVEAPWQFAFARGIATGPVVLVVHNAEAALLRTRAVAGRLVALARRIERAALAAADAVICLSPEDRATLAADYQLDASRWHACGPGVDTEAFRPVSDAERAAAKTTLGLAGPVALFSGSWHLPNRSALAHLEEVARRCPGWTFLVVGSVGTRSASRENVRLTGPVADVLPFFRAADIALNPMLEGSGVNLKVLEYLAMGLPTLATAFGIRGLDVADAVDVVAPAEFAAGMTRLADAPYRRACSRRARAAAEARFGWERVARAREAIYDDVLARRGGSRPR